MAKRDEVSCISMDISKVPVTESDIALDWIRSILGANVGGIRTERIGEAYGFSSQLYRCRMVGTSIANSVVVKLCSSERAADLHEVPFYAEFANRLGVPIPRSYGSAIEGCHAALVLEDFEHAIQGDCLDQLDDIGAAVMARTVAALHATWWESPELSRTGWLPPMSVRSREWLLTRREKCLERFGDRLPPLARELLDRVESVNAHALARLEGAPQTLLHADLHLDNVLFDGGVDHPIILDWARVSRGPAAIDLVELLFLMSPDWESALTIYLDEMRHRGVAVDEPALCRQIGGALLRRFISATCGVSRWDAPSEREKKLIETDQARVFRAIEAWNDRNPDLFTG
jgi:aminoglycoside phosphotransferase (APT) family kinase protein